MKYLIKSFVFMLAALLSLVQSAFTSDHSAAVKTASEQKTEANKAEKKLVKTGKKAIQKGKLIMPVGQKVQKDAGAELEGE